MLFLFAVSADKDRRSIVMRARMTKIQENIRDSAESGAFGLAKSNKRSIVVGVTGFKLTISMCSLIR